MQTADNHVYTHFTYHTDETIVSNGWEQTIPIYGNHPQYIDS